MKIKLFLASLVCWVFVSCNPNTECPPSSKVYNNNLILKVPYQVNDSITFIDSIGNELNFYLKNVSSGFINGYNNIGSDCGQYLHKYEYSKYYFSEKNNKANLFVGNYMKADTLFFKDGEGILYVGINEDNYWFSSYNIQNDYHPATKTILNGTTYNNLSHEKYSNNNETYYSKEFGIVCFRTNDVTWFLKR
jgi:hypothetical protein